MGSRHGPSRRVIWTGAVVAGLILALAVPAIVLGAVAPASFAARHPLSGSSITDTTPRISVRVYDGYGVRGATAYAMYLDGVKVKPKFTYWAGFGYKKFDLAYQVATPRSGGKHTVKVTIRDLKGRNYSTSWSFTITGAPAPPGSHASPTVTIGDCTVTCHQGDIATIHIEKGCAMCHANGVTPQSNCNDCHGSDFAHIHPNMDAVHTAPAQSCTTSTCHGTQVRAIHGEPGGPGCAACHGVGVAEASLICADCHSTDLSIVHAVPAATHASTLGGCFDPLCHPSSDVSLIHTTGDDPPGCVVCHGTTEATLNCQAAGCHNPIPPSAQHQSFTHVSATGTKSGVCTSCHSSDLPTAHNGVFTSQADLGCFCHTNGAGFSIAGEMGPLLAAGKAECLDCHTDPHQAHGFDMRVSGHNTTTYGRVGGYSKFDGSQGVLLKDTEENTITTNWDLPQKNVFWGATDPDAPSTAIKGLSWTSVVTCQDCHTGLNAAGPHGAAQSWGIDPNYDYPYKYAVLGASKKSTAATSTSGIKALTTVSASGTLNINLDAPVAEESTAGVAGIQDGTSGPFAVICAKCHDLFNPPPGYGVNSTTTLDNGWSNAGPDSYEGLHGAHAGGTARNANDSGRWDGRSDCAACHIGVPHGWTRPRLLVNAYTGPYPLGGSWNGTAWVGYTAAQSVADPAPYNVFRGVIIPEQPLPGGGFNTAGNGPNSALDDHSLNAFGLPVWDEAACISCAGGRAPYGLEHNGITSEPAKIK